MTNEARAAQAELKAYRIAKIQLAKLEEDISNVRGRLASLSRPAQEVNIQPNHDQNATERLLVVLADLTAYYSEKWIEAEFMCRRLEQRISQVSGIPGLILRMRYIQGNTMDQVAEDLDYSYRHMIRLHSKALDAFSKVTFLVT